MKKIYSAPEFIIQEVEFMEFIAISTTSNPLDKDGDGWTDGYW